MPTLLSVNDLQNALDSNLAWRKKEVVALRNSAARAQISREYYCRAGSVMLCAHWEGFLRDAVRAYVDHVFAQEQHLSRLKPQFVAIHFFHDVKYASTANFPGSERHHVKLAKKIIASLADPKGRVGWTAETGGNPSSALCSDLLKSVALPPKMGYDESQWSVVKVFIDSQILKDRHKVAHGERFPVRPDEFRSRSGRLIEICEDLARLVTDAAINKSYLAS